MTTTRERALEAALSTLLCNCDAMVEGRNPSNMSQDWRRIWMSLEPARAALSLPPDAPPAAPVAQGERWSFQMVGAVGYLTRPASLSAPYLGDQLAVFGGVQARGYNIPAEDEIERAGKLAAAAPDMLAALQTFYAKSWSLDLPPSHEIWIARNVATAAIARATGREG